MFKKKKGGDLSIFAHPLQFRTGRAQGRDVVSLTTPLQTNVSQRAVTEAVTRSASRAGGMASLVVDVELEKADGTKVAGASLKDCPLVAYYYSAHWWDFLTWQGETGVSRTCVLRLVWSPRKVWWARKICKKDSASADLA